MSDEFYAVELLPYDSPSDVKQMYQDVICPCVCEQPSLLQIVRLTTHVRPKCTYSVLQFG